MKKYLLIFLLLFAAHYSFGQTNWYPPNGNVGIGTTAPDAKLSVIGNTHLSSTSPELRLTKSPSGMARITFASTSENQFYFFTDPASNDFKIRASSTETDASPRIRLPRSTRHVFLAESGGNVGIGTANPQAGLDVRSNSGSIIGNSLYFYGSGAAPSDGLPLARFTEAWGIRFDSPDPKWVLSSAQSVLVGYRPHGQDWGPGNMFVEGRVGIGTTSPDEKLTVKGKIHAEEVRIDLSVPAPDYVFEEDYALRSLEETEQFIKANKHLPEIPPGKELEANGVAIGEMNMKLLQKVEELTLHMIEINKQLIKLQEENKKLHKNFEK